MNISLLLRGSSLIPNQTFFLSSRVTRLVVIGSIALIALKNIASYFADPFERNFQRRYYLYQQAVNTWKQNPQDKKSCDDLRKNVEKVFKHRYFMFFYSGKLGRPMDAQTEVIDRYLKALEQYNKEDVLQYIDTLEKKFMDKESERAVEEARQRKNEGRHYFLRSDQKRPNSNLVDFFKHMRREWAWFLILNGLTTFNNEVVAIEGEYDPATKL